MTLQAEAQAIASIAASYRQRGYQVDIEPSGPGLPKFLEGFTPDLIARRSGDNVVVEVKVGTRTSVADRLRDVAERVNQQPGWRFSVVFADPGQPDQVLDGETTPRLQLEQRVRDADVLMQSGQQEGAFLLLWSALEGILRLLAERAQLPLTNLPSSALIRELYSAGEIGREQCDTLMRLLPVRNRLVHGLGSQERVEAAQLAAVVRPLLGELGGAT
jgi:class 3 adenylate cyclase